jgi:predicted negative regulator of RcsB-dependent stress response
MNRSITQYLTEQGSLEEGEKLDKVKKHLKKNWKKYALGTIVGLAGLQAKRTYDKNKPMYDILKQMEKNKEKTK